MAALTIPEVPGTTPRTIFLPFHPFPNELFPFFLLFGEPLRPQEPFGLILEGGQVPAGAGGEGISAAGAAHGAGHGCLRLGGVLRGRAGGQGRGRGGTGGWYLQRPLQAVRRGVYGSPMRYNN